MTRAEKISAAKKGKPLSAAHRQALSRAHQGVPLSVEHRKAIANGQLGRSRPRKAGHSNSYSAVHKRQVELFGPASQQSCVDCGAQAHDWSSMPNGFEARCRPCHWRFDQ